MAGGGGKRSTSFKKGDRANPKGRPKAIVSVVELARAQTQESIETLVAIRDMADQGAWGRVNSCSSVWCADFLAEEIFEDLEAET
jgi:hypothetical protein